MCAMKFRQSTVACIEMSEAMMAANALVREIENDIRDGVLTTRELWNILRRKLELDIQMLEAVIAAEKSDFVEGKHEWERKEPFADLPRHLRDKENGIKALELELGVLNKKLADNEPAPKRPSPAGARAFIRIGAKKIASQTVRQSARRSDKSIG